MLHAELLWNEGALQSNPDVNANPEPNPNSANIYTDRRSFMTLLQYPFSKCRSTGLTLRWMVILRVRAQKDGNFKVKSSISLHNFKV